MSEQDSTIAIIKIEVSDDEPDVTILPKDPCGEVYVCIKVGFTEIKMKASQADWLKGQLPELDDQGEILL